MSGMFFLIIIYRFRFQMRSVLRFMVDQSICFQFLVLQTLRKYQFCFISRLSICAEFHLFKPWQNQAAALFGFLRAIFSPIMMRSISFYMVASSSLQVFSLLYFLQSTIVLNSDSSNIKVSCIFPHISALSSSILLSAICLVLDLHFMQCCPDSFLFCILGIKNFLKSILWLLGILYSLKLQKWLQSLHYCDYRQQQLRESILLMSKVFPFLLKLERNYPQRVQLVSVQSLSSWKKRF